jgi:SAM-dependent methyltransferase
MNSIQAFIRWNRRLSGSIQRRLRYRYVQDEYVRVLAERLSDGCNILDIGAGKETAFREHLRPGMKVIGVDISAAELLHNRSLTATLVCDVSKAIPLANDSADLVVSRSVVEHLPDVAAFVSEGCRVLRPGGWFIHVLPSRFAPFALLNSFLPNSFVKKFLYSVHEEQRGICGFPAVYDHCWPNAMRKLLTKSGFQVEEIRYQYFSSNYYDFFFPAFLLSVAYEWVITKLNLVNLCAAMLIIARKNPHHG